MFILDPCQQAMCISAFALLDTLFVPLWKCPFLSLPYVHLTLSSRLSLTPVSCMKFLLIVLDQQMSPPPEYLML